jgi:hypothetical protein
MGFSNTIPAALTYISTTNIYVNSGSGNNGGAGTHTDPLQSLEEALKNVHARRITGDFTECKILLSGNVGDYDTTSAIVYYYPGKYINNMGKLSLVGWDGAETDPDVEAPPYLYTGSATLWADPGGTSMDMGVYDGGSLLRLYTDAGYTTAVNFGTPGCLGPLSQGWTLVANSPGRGRPIAHVVDHLGNTNTIRIAGPEQRSSFDQSGSAYGNGISWDTLGRGSAGLKIIKYGAKVDFTQWISASDSVYGAPGMGNYRQEWQFLELTSSNTDFPKAGVGNAGGLLSYYDCHVYFDNGSHTGGTMSSYRCYYAWNDQGSWGGRQGRGLHTSVVFDGQFTEEYPDDFMNIQDKFIIYNYTIFQNYSSSTQGIVFGEDLSLINYADPDFTVLHLTGCAGFYSELRGGGVRTMGNPIRLIGHLNGATEYGLRLQSGSSWQWHSASILMQSDGTTESKVSVTNGESSGSADINSQTFILNYTSSIPRATAAAAYYPTFQTDYSSSLLALQTAAD